MCVCARARACAYALVYACVLGTVTEIFEFGNNSKFWRWFNIILIELRMVSGIWK